jgi:hypothetical protein
VFSHGDFDFGPVAHDDPGLLLPACRVTTLYTSAPIPPTTVALPDPNWVVIAPAICERVLDATRLILLPTMR